MENTGNDAFDASKIKKMFEGFKQKGNTKKRPTKEQILAKYFTPRADKEVFRILPPLDGRDYIETAFFHAVPVNAAGGKKKYRKIFCPAHNDGKVPKTDANGEIIRDQQGKPVLVTKHCPLCAKSKAILSQQDPSLKGIKKDDMNPQQLAIKDQNDKIYRSSNEWAAKKFYIVRGIDKGVEKDGVKFWRFKHDYRQQGVLDKLGPAVTDFMEANGADYSDPVNGTDLKITVVDADQPGGSGRTYRYVSSIYPLGKSKLHADELVVKEWLNDPTTWRDVFKPASAPNIESEEYLEMVANDQAPYWDDSDSDNKRWVFPGRPDLEEAANTRNQDLDAPKEEKVEMASDVVTQSYDNVTIENVTKEDVGTFQDNAVDLTAEVKEAATKIEETVEATTTETVEAPAETTEDTKDGGEDYEDYDDLPF